MAKRKKAPARAEIAALPEPSELAALGLARAAAWIAENRISSEELVRACLDRIGEVDVRVEAWTFLDAEHALEQARAADRSRREGRPLGPLAGVPIGVKDIIDTGDMPTENGTVLHAGRRPLRDAAVVARLRAAGAVILGKTVTTEFAVFAPGKTKNPHHPGHTPGGSSSGSAAAVAAHMVPGALGTQTNGSTIRPAAYCGVYGFKPSHGLVPRTGMLQLSRALDQPGVFARGIEDVALLGDVAIGYDAGDPDSRPSARADLVRLVNSPPPVEPRLAFVKSPVWGEAEESTRAAFAELADALGDRMSEVELPAAFDEAVARHKIVFEAEIAANLDRDYATGKAKFSAKLAGIVEAGRRHGAVAYQQALATLPRLGAALDDLFDQFDAIVTPAATGEAPEGLASTGSPIFCTIWTACGAPALSLPLMRGPKGLPLGVQLVGQRGRDGRLLRTARWLVERLSRG